MREVSFRSNVASSYLQKGTTALLQLGGLPIVMLAVGGDLFAVYGVVLAYVGFVGLATTFVGPVVIARLVRNRSLETVAVGGGVVFVWSVFVSVLFLLLVRSGAVSNFYGISGVQAQDDLRDLAIVVSITSVVLAMGELLYRVLLSVKRGYVVNMLLGLKNVLVFLYIIYRARGDDLSVKGFVSVNYLLESGAYLLSALFLLPSLVGRMPQRLPSIRSMREFLLESKSFLSLNLLNYGSREALKLCAGRCFDQKSMGLVTLALGYAGNLRGLFLGFYLPLIPYKYKKNGSGELPPFLNFVGTAYSLFILSLASLVVSIGSRSLMGMGVVSDITIGVIAFTLLWFSAATLRVVFFYDLKLRGRESKQLLFMLLEVMGMLLFVVSGKLIQDFYTFLFACVSIVLGVLVLVFKSNREEKSIYTVGNSRG